LLLPERDIAAMPDANCDPGRKAMEPPEIVVNMDLVAGNWKKFRGWAKEFWGALTQDARIASAGVIEQHAGRRQVRSGIARANAASQLTEFLHRNRDWDSSSH